MRTLFFDIEATNLSASMGYILCIGYKWSDEKEVHLIRIDQTKEGKKHITDDMGVLVAFEKVWNQADIVIGHFLEYYDIPFIQTRRLIKGLKPMAVTQKVDTWRIAKKRLKFHSNRLAAIISALKCPYQKTELKGDLWIEAMAGNKKAVDYVVKHCKYDVLSLEWIYNKLRPYWDQHPVSNYRSDENACRQCSKGKMLSNGIRPTSKKVYRRLTCSNCGFSDKGKVV